MSLLPQHLRQFRKDVERTLGLRLAEHDDAALERLLAERARSLQMTASDYVSTSAATGKSELQALAPRLAVGETLFFRHRQQLQAFCDVVPALALKRDTRTLKLLSAGCSTGEEPYTLAMLLRSRDDLAHVPFEIQGIDFNVAALNDARTGMYARWALREAPEAATQRWFSPRGQQFLLSPVIRDAVTFSYGNLATGEGLQPSGFDVIFCRNVLIYLSEQQLLECVGRLVSGLTPGGYLFLGHAETLRGQLLDVEACSARGSFFYRRPEPGERSAFPSPPARSVPPGPARAPLVSRVTGTPNAHALSALCRSPALAPVFRAVEAERFVEAHQALRALPQADRAEPAVRLLETLLLVYDNQFLQAEREAHELLQGAAHDLGDELAAGAQFVLGLCSESCSQIAPALRRHRLAAFLDPTFAMPRVRLGMLLRARGDARLAHHELRHARALLWNETSERLLWFAAGCSRSALVALCDRELLEAGDRA